MKKCLVYGNCQASAVSFFLGKHPDFLNQYEVIEFPPVHLLTEQDIQQLEKIATEIDLLVHQPVSDNYRGIHELSSNYLKSRLKSNCHIISFPSAYFTGYHPEVVYLQAAETGIIEKPFSYHDINILKMYAQGFSVEEATEQIQSESFYNLEFIEDNLKNTLFSLEQREKDLDIKLSGFIQENFRKSKLFHTFNHPNPLVLEFIINCILIRLDIHQEQDFFTIFTNPDVLARSSFPIYPSLKSLLDMLFESPMDYKIENTEYTLEKVVEIYYKFYRETHSQVEAYLKYTVCRT